MIKRILFHGAYERNLSAVEFLFVKSMEIVNSNCLKDLLNFNITFSSR